MVSTDGPDAAANVVVTNLFTTPVKGFGLDAPSSVTLTAYGAIGDREFYVVDAARRLLSITRTGAFAGWHAAVDRESSTLTLTAADGQRLEGEVTPAERLTVNFWGSRDVVGHVVGGRWSADLSEIAGQPVDLVRIDHPSQGFDETSVTVLSQESVAELARATGSEAIDARRFRMLINVTGGEPFAEESWRPSCVRVGTALLQMQGPVPRCNATRRNPDSGKVDLQTLKLLAAARGLQPTDFGQGLNLGVYAVVVEPGVVSLGDTLELVEG